MGTLHEVYQIKPRVLNGGALLKVQLSERSNQIEIEEQFIKDYFEELPLSNLVFQRANPHLKVFGIYQEDRMIENPDSGDYFLVQSGSKYGFGQDFEDFLSKYAKDLQDAFFYVGYGDWIYSYEIKGDKFLMNQTALGTRTFIEYILDSCQNQKELLSDLYFEELLTVYDYCKELKTEGYTLDWYYDNEDYEQYRVYLEYIKDPVWKTKFRTCLIEILKY